MKSCKVKGCNNKFRCKGYCQRHYSQYLIYGKTYITSFDKNKIIKYDDYAEIIIYNKSLAGKEPTEKCRTKIDLEDIDKIKNIRWTIVHNKRYVGNSAKKLYLYQLIMDCPKDKEVDHINHDVLDNCKNNLRIVTRSQNMMNKKIKGYHYCKTHKKWRAMIKLNQKEKSIGYYNTEEEAKEARRKAEIKYFGEYRYKRLDWSERRNKKEETED